MEWVTASNPCPECAALEGHRFPMDEATGMLPLHPNCYDKETEIYTNEGWKLFKDLNKEETILSLNPENFDLDYLKPIDYIDYDYNGKMINFKGQGIDLSVTPNHRMFVGRRPDVNKRDYIEWRFVSADKLNGKYKFHKSSKWIGKEIKEMQLGSKKVPFELYAEFMGWYLSEGSVVTSRKGRCIISQSKEKNYDNWCRIKELLTEIGFKIYITKIGFEINDIELWEWLKQFGKCNEKYIPQEIKDAKPEKIRIFLDAYCLGDGHKRDGRKWKNGNFKPEITYFTSSKRIADDLGELLIKSAKSVSYRLMKTKGQKVKFKNGTYTINRDIWRISELNGRNVKKTNKNEIEYSDKVYCVSLPKYHTLLIRRGGKVNWCGNCECALIPVGRGEL
jgi:hypothetical protein